MNIEWSFMKNLNTPLNDAEPLISVVLPIYNIEKYLQKCMDSLLGQTYRNLEIIMIDDGSTDGSGKLCDFYEGMDDRIVVFHKKNGGLSDARNYGLEHASGEYITFIDPDDFVDLDFIEYMYQILKKYDTKMSLCQHRVHYINGKIKDYGSTGDEALDNKFCLERMLYHDVIDTSAWAKLYSMELFQEVRYPKGKIFEDIGTTYALMLQSEKIACGYESKYNYIIHKTSIVNGEFKRNKLDLLEMTDKMAAAVVKRYPDLADAVLRRQVYARLSTLNQMLNVKGYQDERRALLDYIKKNRFLVLNNPKTPRRDKIALKILRVSYKLYRFSWGKYEQYVKGKNK